MSLPSENNKVIKSVEIDSPVGEKNLLRTIENTPEDRLDLLQQMTKLKLSLEKAQNIINTNQLPKSQRVGLLTQRNKNKLKLKDLKIPQNVLFEFENCRSLVR